MWAGGEEKEGEEEEGEAEKGGGEQDSKCRVSRRKMDTGVLWCRCG
jgi:hypothetical protein